MADEEFESVACAMCTISFGVTKAMSRLRHGDQLNFYCPNGHANMWRASKVDPKDEKITNLEKVLAEVRERASKLQAEVEALRLEVEVWRPRTAVKEAG
jgi:hypothetical protein